MAITLTYHHKNQSSMHHHIIEIANAESKKGLQHQDFNKEAIHQYAEEAGFFWVDQEMSSWCSVFLNWAAQKAGLEQTNSAMARSWLNAGYPVTDPKAGDIVVFWQEAPNSKLGQVGIFMGFKAAEDAIEVLGGLPDHSIALTSLPKHQLLGFRRLRPAGPIFLPKQILLLGDNGPGVTFLQKALKTLFYYEGAIDGQFGQQTERAIYQLQSTSYELEMNGIFDKETRAYMEELIDIH